jgi:hypothetical protein
MSRNKLVLAVSAAALAAVMLPAAPAAAATFGTAIEVPGTAALNAGGSARVLSMSCAASGDCSAGGDYADASGNNLPFVVGEAGGTWGSAIEVPGFAALPSAASGVVESVSCSSPGNCAASGVFSDAAALSSPFVVSETGGTWGQAIEVPGAAALNPGGLSDGEHVSCVPGHAGDCAVVGYYEDGSQHLQAFVAGETGGTWGQAIEVPGTAALNTGGLASADQVSCPAPGRCTLGGKYTNSQQQQIPYVASERNGTWGTARTVPGITGLASGEFAGVEGLACASAGNCSATGLYMPGGSDRELYVTTETNGTWSQAEPMPGLAALNKTLFADVTSLSCASAGDCAAGGFYRDGQGTFQPFVISQSGGVWGQVLEVPGAAVLNKGGAAVVQSVSCASPGNCVGGGDTNPFVNKFHNHFQAFTVRETGGKWQHMLEVPGTPALNTGDVARVNAVACARGGTCSLGGFYQDGTFQTGHDQAFVDSQS